MRRGAERTTPLATMHALGPFRVGSIGMRDVLRGSALLVVVAAAMAAVPFGFAACGGNGAVTYATPFDASALDDHYIPPGSVGEACSADRECRTGLTCAASSLCAPGHSSTPGTPCTISAECVAADYCGPARTCAPAGSGASGATCASDADCAAGLRCDMVGLTAQCTPEGSTDVGGACTTSATCFGGLACSNGACVALPPSTGAPPLGVSTWAGVTCTDDTGPTAAYFRVPRGTGDGDFFRLPFPNDIRTNNGHPDFSLFPTPGAGVLGYDLVARYAAFIDANDDGFSEYPTVTVRFSGAIDFGSLNQPQALQWLQLGESGAAPVGFEWTMTTGRNQYVCDNALSARPQLGLPLAPGTQFAFIVSTSVTTTDGKAIAVPSDLTALLSDSPPTDSALAAAYATYAPLRTWAASNGGTSKVLDATLFTTSNATALAKTVVDTVTSAAAPTAASWTLCNGTNASPCPQATGDRACGTPDPAFYELHALVTLPIVQSGTEPYLDPTQGGDVADGSGNVAVTRTEQVCMSLTIPKTTMPSGGFPLVVYAHGTGGSFRSEVPEGVAGNLAGATSSAGVKTPMAVLGIDQVETGTRRGASTESPDDLFYNFANPAASRGNPLQGAADQASLYQFAKTLTVDASITGTALKFASIAFWGHSQGATEGGIALPYVKGYAGAVLSGEGASLVDALLTKKNPVDVAAVVPIVLEDPAVDVYHPALALFQTALDEADPLNHAAGIAVAPLTAIGAKHLFQPYGLGDTYAPPVTQQTFAVAARLGVAMQPASLTTPDSIGDITPTAVPASGNLTVGTSTVTAFVREYQPGATYDGHFVAFQNADAEQDVSTFLADVVSGVVPKVGH
jgi:hypothetical protein